MFTAAKDAMTSRAAQSYVNNLIGRYGRVTELRLDSRQKTIDVTGELIGEVTPVTIRIGAYEVIAEDGKKFVRVAACSASREWLDRLMNDQVRGRKFELPGWAAAAL